MSAHHVVEREAARLEPLGLGIIGPVDQPHRFGHDIAVEPRRAERVLRHHPPRRKNHEVAIGAPRRLARAGQDGEDRRIGMVETDRADGVEPGQVIFPRREIAVPRDDIERAVIEVDCPQAAEALLDQLERFVAILIPGGRRLEIARVGKPVRSDRAKLRQPQQRPMILGNIAACRAIRQQRSEPYSARHQRNLARRHHHSAQLGQQLDSSALRHEQQLAIGTGKGPRRHVGGGGINMHRDALHRPRVAIGDHRRHAVDQVGRRHRHRPGRPAQTIGRQRLVDRLRCEFGRSLVAAIGGMACARPQPVQPAAPIFVPRRGECRSRQLLGIQPERRLLR